MKFDFCIFMKKLIILSTAVLLAFGQHASAQPKIQEILQRLPDKTIPYQGDKYDYRDKGSTGVYHADGKLDDRLYENVQLTEWHNACDYPAKTPESCHDFVIPGRNIHLLKISFGGIDYITDVLLSVTPDGEILDQMPVAVMTLPHIGNVPVMQYEITSDAKIIVCRLEPVSDVSIPLIDLGPDAIASFTANRVDRTYEINPDGKYVLVNTKRYKEKTYDVEMLADRAYNIYSGDETPM